MRKGQIRRLKTGFLLLFVFSIPFEYWDPFGIASFFTVTKMAGFGYAAVSFITYKFSLDKGVSYYVFYLFLFWFLLVILSMANFKVGNTVSVFNFTLLQNIFLYWLVASDLKNGLLNVKFVLLSFLFSIILMSFLLAMGIGIDQEYVEGVSRITFFENNSNTVGVLAGLAIVFSVHFCINPKQNFGRRGYLMLLALPTFLNMLLLSGSRGALITVVFSISLMLIMNKTTRFRRVIQFVILIFGAVYFMQVLSQSEMMYVRMIQLIEQGDTAGRDQIWKDVVFFAQERPFLGYGSTGFENEMVKLYGVRKDPHNLFLYILVTTGFIGLMIFMLFLFYHVRISLKSFRRGNVFKIVLLVFYLTTVIKAGGIINSKLMWLLLAIILTAEFALSRPPKYLLK